ncbi:hypothetical protein Godav_000137 [Gossypium davidsonii]|uniref:Uncharacterized protein n=2 Tax=Gossypium TaxID=3633 RepID=A0A7J8T674_GOSDV|nr:hypothetical protein [Gossypium davidsonii]MBA0668524.1 hypothetical protein [Gossypium klotzschianum]
MMRMRIYLQLDLMKRSFCLIKRRLTFLFLSVLFFLFRLFLQVSAA